MGNKKQPMFDENQKVVSGKYKQPLSGGKDAV